MRIPTSCYRLQLSPAFAFDDARLAAPYLRDLGVGDLYLSPILAARPGSRHGYDVCDPTRVSPELGGIEGLERLAGELRRLDMGLLVDIVPNHMAADHRNPWWWDVLLRGRESVWAHAYDIEWDAPGADGRLVLPLLGSARAEAIARGELRLVQEEGEARVAYFDQRYPVAAGGVGGDVEAVLAAQHYRLEDWRTGVPNYRRFFDIADLPAVAVEHEDVFTAVHAEMVRLVRGGIVTGLRIDHIDGLCDPAGYLERLRDATDGAYVVVEKILARGESLPADWATAGTTGYDFLALAGGLFVDPDGAARLHRAHRRLTGLPARFEDIAEEAKRAALDGMLAPDLARVARAAPSSVDPDALRELTVALDVYRTYVRDGDASAPDVARLRAAGERAGGGGASELASAVAAPAPELRPFVWRWQQLTGPAAAKGVEDTALYVDAALLARNEPGCEPSWASTGAAELHARLSERSAGHPLNATSTHDTKSSEDVRMRISALSELAEEWEEAFARWHERNAPLRRRPDAAPDGNEEWLLYQTLVGAWPIGIERVGQFLRKALREAKVHTSWAAPDEAYENDVQAFAEAILGAGEFTDDLAEFAGRCATIGERNSLELLVLKLAAPGVPDVYWGNEDWDLSLVDPDNRRPVDFGGRAARGEASLKATVTRAGLRLRRRDPELFAYGAYVPLEVTGACADRVVGFARAHEGRWAIAAVSRLTERLGSWADTRLVPPDGAPDRWNDAIRDAPVDDLSAASLFAHLPAALLTG